MTLLESFEPRKGGDKHNARDYIHQGTYFRSNPIVLPEVETPIEIWPFRFLKGVHIFIFFQIANLAVQIFIFFKTQIQTPIPVQIFSSVYRFAFLMKIKM